MAGISSIGKTYNPYIDGLMSGYRWAGGSITYSMPSSILYYPSSYDGYSINNFRPVTTVQQQAIEQILEGTGNGSFGPLGKLTNFESVANLSIQKNAATSTADIMIGRSSSVTGPYGAIYDIAFTAALQTQRPTIAGDVFLQSAYFDNPVPGNFAWYTLMHEFGHALGLKHPHEVTTDFGSMPLGRDAVEFEVMSYRAYLNAPTSGSGSPAGDGGFLGAADSYPQTLMMYDIAALQSVYGANFNTNSGNTRYSWFHDGDTYVNGVKAIDAVTVAGRNGFGRIFETIWDGGGIDTYDARNSTTAVNIDLTPGWWSTVNLTYLTADLAYGQKASGQVYNALLYNGDTRSLIENAVGGVGNDRISGNQADNFLSGGESGFVSQGPALVVRGWSSTLTGTLSNQESLIHISDGGLYQSPGAGWGTSGGAVWYQAASTNQTNYIPGTQNWSPRSRVVDLNGDGTDEIVDIKSDGSIQHAGLQWNGYTFLQYVGTWGTGATIHDQIVNVNSTAAMEVVQFYNGRVYVGAKNGTADLNWSVWATGGTNQDQLIDLNGDGRADLLQFYGGREYVALSTGTSFGSWSVWGTGATASDQFVDVNNDGKRDILQIYNGREYVALSTGSSFGNWTVWGTGATLSDRLVDVNGDGRADMLQIYDGRAYVALSTGSTFTPWSVKATGVRDDAFVMHADNGQNGTDQYLDLVQFIKGETWLATGNSSGFGSFTKTTRLATDGNDVLTGGPGHDNFVFNVGWASDTITDFEFGVDTMQIDREISSSFADVMAHASQVGSNVLLYFDTNHVITLQNFHLNQLAYYEFSFV